MAEVVNVQNRGPVEMKLGGNPPVNTNWVTHGTLPTVATTTSTRPVSGAEFRVAPKNGGTVIMDRPVEVDRIVDRPVPVEVDRVVERPVPVEVHDTRVVEVPVPVPVETVRMAPRPPAPKEVVVERVVEPSPPQPVIVKTVHEETIIKEDPTEVHYVELKKPAHVRSAPPPVQAPVKHKESKFPWWWLLLLLCCLPLCCLPCLLCQREKKYRPSAI